VCRKAPTNFGVGEEKKRKNYKGRVVCNCVGGCERWWVAGQKCEQVLKCMCEWIEGEMRHGAGGKMKGRREM
jgi:hypothetical protein